jgi:hypothetical protein
MNWSPGGFLVGEVPREPSKAVYTIGTGTRMRTKEIRHATPHDIFDTGLLGRADRLRGARRTLVGSSQRGSKKSSVQVSFADKHETTEDTEGKLEVPALTTCNFDVDTIGPGRLKIARSAAWKANPELEGAELDTASSGTIRCFCGGTTDAGVSSMAGNSEMVEPSYSTLPISRVAVSPAQSQGGRAANTQLPPPTRLRLGDERRRALNATNAETIAPGLGQRSRHAPHPDAWAGTNTKRIQ